MYERLRRALSVCRGTRGKRGREATSAWTASRNAGGRTKERKYYWIRSQEVKGRLYIPYGGRSIV